MKKFLLNILILFGTYITVNAQIGKTPLLNNPDKTEIFTKIGKYWVTYHKDSTIESRGRKIDLKGRNKKWIFYYPSGKIKEQGRYKNDTRIGKWKYFNERGELLKIETMK